MLRVLHDLIVACADLLGESSSSTVESWPEVTGRLEPVVGLSPTRSVVEFLRFGLHWRPASVAFGTPMAPETVVALGARGAAERCRTELEALLTDGALPFGHESARSATTTYIVKRATRRLDCLTSRERGTPSARSVRAGARAVAELLELALIKDPANPAALLLRDMARRMA